MKVSIYFKKIFVLILFTILHVYYVGQGKKCKSPLLDIASQQRDETFAAQPSPLL